MFSIGHFIRTQAKVVWPENGTQITGGTGLGRPAYLETKERETLVIHTCSSSTNQLNVDYCGCICIEREYIYNITLCCCYIDVSNRISRGRTSKRAGYMLCCAALRPARLVRRLRFLCEKQKGKRAAPVERVGSVHFIYISFLLVDVCVVFRLCRHLIGSPFISAGQDGLR